MRIRLVVTRDKDDPRIWAMVWSSAEDDPKLVESRRFRGTAAFQVWLAGIAIRYGRSNITVDSTATLRSDDRLAATVRECVEA